MTILFLADGFEEAEALVPLDLLRRAGCDIQTVSISDERTVTGSHGIPVVCDLTGRELVTEGLEMVVLPGGMPGTNHLMQSPLVARYLDRFDVKMKLDADFPYNVQLMQTVRQKIEEEYSTEAVGSIDLTQAGYDAVYAPAQPQAPA